MIDPREYTILIVDDELSIRVYLERALSLKGYQVVTAGRRPEALDRAAMQVFDAVLLDIGLPRISGFEVLHQLHKDYPDNSVVMVSAELDPEMAENAIKAGAFDCMTKPIDLDDLLILVARACEQFEMGNLS